MKKTLRTAMIIVIAAAALLNISFVLNTSEVHAFGDLYATKSTTVWDSTKNTKNASLNQSAKLPKATSSKTTYNTVSKKSATMSVKAAKSVVNKAKKAAPVWKKTSYQWTNGKFQRITIYQDTIEKAAKSGKKMKVTKTLREKVVTETYKHFKKEYAVS